MTIIFWLFILCLLVVFWHSSFGRKHDLTGEYGALVYFFWESYFKIKYRIQWFFEAPENARMTVSIFLAIAAYIFFSLLTSDSINPFKVYKQAVYVTNAWDYEACKKRLGAARDSGDEQKIRDVLSVCENNPEYQRIKNIHQSMIPQYNACQQELNNARAAGDLRKMRNIYESWECQKNIYFSMSKAYPQFEAEKYAACRLEMQQTLGISRPRASDFRGIHETCFKKYRGPLRDIFFPEESSGTN